MKGALTAEGRLEGRLERLATLGTRSDDPGPEPMWSEKGCSRDEKRRGNVRRLSRGACRRRRRRRERLSTIKGRMTMTEPTPFLMPLWKNERRPRPKSPRKTYRQNMSMIESGGTLSQDTIGQVPPSRKGIRQDWSSNPRTLRAFSIWSFPRLVTRFQRRNISALNRRIKSRELLGEMFRPRISNWVNLLVQQKGRDKGSAEVGVDEDVSLSLWLGGRQGG